MNRHLSIAVLLAILLHTAVSTSSRAKCSGRATYRVTFQNFLTPARFGKLIPSGGLVFSPLAGVSHSNRQSFLTVRGFASRGVEQIAETGVNARFVRRANRLREMGRGVKTVASADGPTPPGHSTILKFQVDCEHPFITVLGMIAPSPDWIVQINNRNTYMNGRFVNFMSGSLIAYDSGTDDGREFTAPGDPTLDMPTDPKLNIAPLVEDETDRFEGRVVGKWIIKKMT